MKREGSGSQPKKYLWQIVSAHKKINYKRMIRILAVSNVFFSQ
jgi:hypothetical protein